jgi:hypothetical protein
MDVAYLKLESTGIGANLCDSPVDRKSGDGGIAGVLSEIARAGR